MHSVTIPAGSFQMGDGFGEGYPADGEAHVHEVAVDEFQMMPTTVTNADFERFVDATGYRTESEVYGYSAVFHLALTAPESDVLNRVPGAQWWLAVQGADWRHPGGRGAPADPRHPVVQVSWTDAQAYCAWAGARLPSEAEWEYAARGGLVGQRFPWGNELLTPDGHWQCNIWQGTFPTHNSLADGHLATAPADAYQPNGFGLYNMVGNVWEWCADWFSPTGYADAAPDPTVPISNPTGPADGTHRVMRGGSFLCHDSYCYRYRVAARSSNTPDSASSNVGFRCVWPA